MRPRCDTSFKDISGSVSSKLGIVTGPGFVASLFAGVVATFGSARSSLVWMDLAAAAEPSAGEVSANSGGISLLPVKEWGCECGFSLMC